MSMKKTTLLFELETIEQLRQKAKLAHISFGELVRRAVKKQYLITTREEKIRAAKELAKMEFPIGNPEEIKGEIIRGFLKNE